MNGLTARVRHEYVDTRASPTGGRTPAVLLGEERFPGTSELDQLAITTGEMGEGEWGLTLEGGETVEATRTDVEVDENRGLEAEGRTTDEAFLVELATGPQPGGPIRLRRRGLTDDE